MICTRPNYSLEPPPIDAASPHSRFTPRVRLGSRVVRRLSATTVPSSSCQIRNCGFRTFAIGIGIHAASLFVVLAERASYQVSFAVIAASFLFAYA
jgi:hypothetical protein